MLAGEGAPCGGAGGEPDGATLAGEGAPRGGGAGGGEPVVYLLRNGVRTYVGATLYMDRRLRQHNGEIRGGARQTSRGGGSWEVACKGAGLRPFNEALKVEFAWRREGRRIRARGVNGRRIA